jgi:hypothetical protein
MVTVVREWVHAFETDGFRTPPQRFMPRAAGVLVVLASYHLGRGDVPGRVAWTALGLGLLMLALWSHAKPAERWTLGAQIIALTVSVWILSLVLAFFVPDQGPSLLSLAGL